MQPSTYDQSAEFEAAVVDSFSFLETSYGFVRRSLQPQKYTQLVVYESTRLFVTLSYGPPSYEPEMSFGRRGIDDVPGSYCFHSGDLLQLEYCQGWTWKKSHGDALSNWVGELARLLALCGTQCLAADSVVFTQMKARRDKLVLDWRRNEQLKVVREQIDLAWKAKDYKKVLGLYQSVDQPTNLDKKRIAFALTRVEKPA